MKDIYHLYLSKISLWPKRELKFCETILFHFRIRIILDKLVTNYWASVNKICIIEVYLLKNYF